MTNFIGKHHELIKFSSVGAINTTVDVTVFWVLLHLWSPGHSGVVAAFESFIAWGVASLGGYFMHSRFTFRTRLPVVGFYGVTAIGVAIQMFLSGFGTVHFGHGGALVGKIVGVVIATGITFTGYRLLAKLGSGVKTVGSVHVSQISKNLMASPKLAQKSVGTGSR